MSEPVEYGQYWHVSGEQSDAIDAHLIASTRQRCNVADDVEMSVEWSTNSTLGRVVVVRWHE